MSGPLQSLPDKELDRFGSWPLYFFIAAVSGVELWLNDVHLAVEWSEFDACHFRQRVRPITNEHGFTAQGSFANSPAIYRNCVFERVRFKLLGGFNLQRGWYEGCSFINCRWEGHGAQDASLVDCTFIGQMNGCVWFGESDRRPNVARSNDFSQVQFTDNVGWRRSFPVGEQRWPEGFRPRING